VQEVLLLRGVIVVSKRASKSLKQHLSEQGSRGRRVIYPSDRKIPSLEVGNQRVSLNNWSCRLRCWWWCFQTSSHLQMIAAAAAAAAAAEEESEMEK
jgi:hypothetical protein